MDSLNSFSYANEKEEVKHSDKDDNSGGTVSEEIEEQDCERMNKSSS